ncbi:substrate-binding periplasmic protein [Thalassospira australica]|uniref:substrate-binding periplasmic protein n=1 Tax=Thalassospira australica TaxID=1528106 RepID=UPI00138DF601|nr:transporter substrate-binding domain-containing protein [Thalassospira australica]
MRQLFVFVCFLMLLSPSLKAWETLHIFADDNAIPKNWLDENGTPQGINIEVLQEVTRRTGIEFTYSFVPWNRAYESARKGWGGIIGLSKTQERKITFDYSQPMYFDELVFVTSRDNVFSFTGLDNMRGYTIGVKRGASYGDDFELARELGLLSILESPDRAGQMLMLSQGRVDAVLLSPGKIAFASVMASNDWLTDHLDEFVIVSPAYKLDPNYLGIPKILGKSHLIAPINTALAEIFEDGTHERIVKRVTDAAVRDIQSSPPQVN